MEPEAQRLHLEVGKKHFWNLAGWHSQCLIAMQTSWFDLQPPEFQVASPERQLPPPLAQNNHKLGVCFDFRSTQLVLKMHLYFSSSAAAERNSLTVLCVLLSLQRFALW